MFKRAPYLALLLPMAVARAQPVPPHTPPGNHLTYTNTEYGFRFVLPRAWVGYSVRLSGNWSGTPVVDGTPQEDQARQEQGPLLRIRNPHWTKADPYEDIPIMIFTRAQWAMVEHETLITGAAPFPPAELGRNAKYVFALPPRYNFDYATGWEAVEKIMDTKPLHAF